MKRFLLLFVIFAPFFLAPLTSYAAEQGWLIKDAQISKLGNTIYSATASAFFIEISGGTGLCAGNTIVFRLNETDKESFQRAYSAALAAFSANFKVSIYSWADAGVCDRAAYIEIYK